MTRQLRVRASDIKPGSALRLDDGHDGVCLVRVEDRFFAIGDRCSHENVSLSEGDVDVEDCLIECWKHGSAFSLLDGSPQSLPAVKPVPSYRVYQDGDDVVVEVP